MHSETCFRLTWQIQCPFISKQHVTSENEFKQISLTLNPVADSITDWTFSLNLKPVSANEIPPYYAEDQKPRER